jgi:hypothetical protein
MRAAYKAATSAFRPPDPAGAFPGKKRPRFAQVLVHFLMFLFLVDLQQQRQQQMNPAISSWINVLSIVRGKKSPENGNN